MSKKDTTAHFKAIRKELAEELGFDVNKLTAIQSMRVDVVFGLKSSLDEMRGRLYRGEAVDTGEMRQIADTLEKYLPAQSKPDPTPAIYRQDPYVVMEGILDRWLAADEEERAERGLSPRIHDEAAQQARIDQLEIELAELRAKDSVAQRNLPAPERGVITPTESEVIPPGEIGEFYHGGPRPGPDDPKPPVTIEGKPEGSWTGPQDGPPSWLRPVPPTDPAKRPPASPPVAKSGAEAERQRQRANSDRSVEHKVMGSARMVQPDNLSSGFFWGGASGKRAW